MASVAAGVTEANDMRLGSVTCGGAPTGAGSCGKDAYAIADAIEETTGYAEKELPQPQPPVAFGFLNVKPEPCIDET